MKIHYLHLIIWLVLLFQGCARYEKISPEISFVRNNVLLPNITFKTNQESEVFIEYWPIDNPKSVQRSKASYGVDHNLVLINLKQTTNYKYVIKNVSTDKKSEVFNFVTSSIPDEIIRVKKSLIDTAQFKGYVLVRKLATQSSDVIIDNKGDVVWYNQYDTVVRRAFVWTHRNSILSTYDSAQVVEYDIYGKKILDIKLKNHGISNSLHHDVLYNSKDEIVALTLDSIKMDLRKLGGGSDQFIRADGIIVFNKAGKKIWEWNLLNVYDPVKNFSVKVDLKQSLGHANSLAIDKDGHYLVSFRDFSQIWKINSVDGSVIWKLGKNGDFKMAPEGNFIAQHSIYFNELGELMIFDNGDRSRPNSRVMAFELDEKIMEAKVRLNIELPLELSAFKMCSAELISKGKYLICTSKKDGIISVVDDNGKIMWRVDLSNPSYRAYYLSNPFAVTNQ